MRLHLLQHLQLSHFVSYTISSLFFLGRLHWVLKAGCSRCFLLLSQLKGHRLVKLSENTSDQRFSNVDEREFRLE